MTRFEDWLFDGSELGMACKVLGLIATLFAAIMIPLWLTGALNGAACPKGKTLVLIPAGKVLVPECLG